MKKEDGTDIVPSYLKEMVDFQIAQAKGLQNGNTMSFVFFTDPHIESNSSFADITTLNYINRNMDIEFAVCCGDNLGNGDTKEIQLDTASRLVNNIDIDNYFLVKGNHDDNSLWSEGVDNIKYTMLPQEQYDIMFRKLESKVKFDASNKYGLYYYHDIHKNKVRAIFLNSIDIPYLPDEQVSKAWKYAGQSTYAYSDAQLNWLAHTALQLPSKEWKVMFFTHINPFNEGMIGADNIAYNSDILLQIIDAFRAGISYNSIPSSGDFAQAVSVNFSSQGEGDVIAFFYGHTHSEQVLVRDGIKYISTWNDSPYKPRSNPNAPNRILGTTSEICLNIVTLDFAQDKIFMTKFGAGNDLII
ncbi:MAG: metallophosphoesterase [Bacillota bacterium]|nr:metallophosphoesterase [Bacillota bacterium]